MTIAFIFARGGSKGLPGKNLRPLLGRSLLARAVDSAKHAKGIERVIVSTDDEEIATAALAAGAEAPFRRPAALASDTAAEWLSWRHAISWMRSHDKSALRRFVSIPTTAPLRIAADIDSCIAAFDQGGCDAVITVRPAERNPYFNMVSLDSDGRARLAAQPGEAVTRRQAAPVLYDMTTAAYIASPDFVMTADGLFEGKVRAVVIPKERAIDIDDEWDMAAAEAYLQRAGRTNA